MRRVGSVVGLCLAALWSGCSAERDPAKPPAPTADGGGTGGQREAGIPDGGAPAEPPKDGGTGGRSGGGGGGGGGQGNDGESPDPGSLDPDGDDDGDGISNGDERGLSLDPQSWDSDDDGLADPDEVGDVAKPKDSDEDGVIDALESDLTDNDLDGIYDTTDKASGWQVAAGRFYPSAIANDGRDSTRVEVLVTGAGVTRVALQTPNNFYDATVLPDELSVDGTLVGGRALELFDDGTHGDRFAGDGAWSRGGISTKMEIRSATGTRDWVTFVKLLVTSANGDEERYLGVPAPNATSDAVLQRSQGFFLGVLNAPAVVKAKVIEPTLQRTPHLVNIVDGRAAVALKRRFLSAGAVAAATVPDVFRPVLERIPGDVDFVSVFPPSNARGSLAAAYFGASVEASGTGLAVHAPDPAWGSEGGKLKGGIIVNFSLSAPLNHEIMHHWGVFLSPSLGFGDGQNHWGVAGTGGVLGGFDPKTFIDNKDGTYSIGFFSPAGNDWNTTPFSPLELYLAGLAPASEVLPITTMQDATVVGRTDTTVIVTGTRKVTTIEQIVAQHGARQPSFVDSQKAFTMAFAVYSEKPLTSVEMSWLDTYADFFGRQALPGSMSFYESTSGRATMNTALPTLEGE